MKYIYTLVIGTLLFTAGCSNKSSDDIKIPAPPTMTVSGNELNEVLAHLTPGAPVILINDDKYLLPTPGWIKNDFSAGLFEFQAFFGISRWSTESNDCDKFALATVFYAHWLHEKSPNRTVSAGITCGEVYYISSRGGPHAINFFVVSNKGELQVIFYEPQTCSIIQLSPAELKSITLLKL